jgi:tRNA A-37 threonylcarbamoyl transferase component Bud32
MTLVPDGYEVQRERGATVVALPSVMKEVCDAIRTAGSLHDAAARVATRSFHGRGSAHVMNDWVVRHYRRGGAIAKVSHDAYVRAGTPRPLRELHASTAARRKGVRTPEVVAAIVYAHGLVYRGDIATRIIPDSRSLADIAINAQRADRDTRLQAWRATGALLRSAFDAGVHHADLNLGNILVVGETALLIDLDRAHVSDDAVSGARRAAMLARFHRSRRKLEAAAGYTTPEGELAAFDRALRGEA